MADITASEAPSVALTHLDHLWFQVAGTLCNLTCHHCFISCSPHNKSFGFLTFEQVKAKLEESKSMGVKEYYFTGGEPFLNPEMTEILIETLRYGPASVLSNGTVLKDQWLERLRNAEAESLYSLEFRISLDGFSPESNDPIRGDGVFERTMRGVEKLVQFGFLPIITAARTWADDQEQQVLAEFTAMLKARGYSQPRLKILPTLQIGAEAVRTCGYRESERITADMMLDFDQSQLICEHSRIVTDRGVHVCPILIEEPDSLLGDSLAGADRSYRLSHGACYTCYQYGSICSNPSGGK